MQAMVVSISAAMFKVVIMLRLIMPDTHYLESYVEALREGYQLALRPLKTAEEISVISRDPYYHFMQENRQGGMFTHDDGNERPLVSHSLFWLVDDETFIGSISIRYHLNDFLEQHAGHIGYGVRPSMRREGYAIKMLTLGLEVLRSRGISRVLLAAEEYNIGSWKTIESNGGVMENKIPSIYVDGQVTRRYWIEI